LTILNRKALRLTTFLIITTLLLGLGSAEDELEWIEPEDGEFIPDTPDFNISDPAGVIEEEGDENEEINVTFSEDNETWEEISVEQIDEDGYVTPTWEDTESSGEYYLNATNINNTDRNQTIEVTLDKTGPVIDSKSPSNGEYISDDSPTVEAEFEDDRSGVHYTNLTVYEDSDREDLVDYTFGETDNPELDTDLNDTETYYVEWWVNDTLGNDRGNWEDEEWDDEWSFTVTTSFEGDEDVDFDPSGGLYTEDEFEDDYNEELEITVYETGDEVSEKEVICKDDSDDEIDSDGFESLDGEDEVEFYCDVDMSDYGDSTVDIYVEVCDEAGHCEESDSEEYTFDGSPPTVLDLDTVSGHYIFNDEFEVEFEALDDTSGVDQVEYYFDFDGAGDGTRSSESDGTISLDIDPSELDDGEHTLYVRAQDNLGQWSTPQNLDFEYYPDDGPEVEIDTPEQFEVEAGSTGDFDLSVENTGMFIIEDLEIEGHVEDIFNQSETVSHLDNGSVVSLTWEIETEDEDLGSHDLEISSEGPSYSAESELLVTANEDQKQEIDQQFSGHDQSLDALRSNITELEEDGLSEERSEEAEAAMASFEERMDEAERAIEDGEYYKADEALSGISSDFSEAEQTYEEVRSDHISSQRTRMLMVLLVLIGVGGIGAVGFFAYSEEYDFDLESVVDSDISVNSLEGIESRVNAVLKNEDEAEEFSWDGFRD